MAAPIEHKKMDQQRKGVMGKLPKYQSNKSQMPIETCIEKMNGYIFSEENTMPFLETCPSIITYDEIEKRRSYSSIKTRPFSVVHNGQLKLFLTEVQFLTNYCKDIDEEIYVIYAGSAPGNKNIYLSELFPKIKFIFVDPNEHFFKMGTKNQYTNENIMDRILYFSVSGVPFKFDFKKYLKPPHSINLHGKGKVDRNDYYDYKHPTNDIGKIILEDTTHNIFVIEDYFSSELSSDLHHLIKNSGKRVFFISDIRTNLRGEQPDEDGEISPTNADILWNSAQMYNWLSILQPNHFMLKFRCPFDYADPVDKVLENKDILECKEDYGLDFVENYINKKFIFIRPDHIFLQAYTGPTSTETRLVGSYPFTTQEFDIKDYEDRFFYYNNIIRPYGWHNVPDVFLNKYRMVDRCGDCSLMSRIFIDYVLFSYKNKRQPPTDIIHQLAYNTFEKTLDILERHRLTSSIDNHGAYYFKYHNADMFRKHQKYLCYRANRYLLKYDIENGEKQFSQESKLYYLKHIFCSDSLRKNRNICIIRKLFGVKNYNVVCMDRKVELVTKQNGSQIIKFPPESERELRYRKILNPTIEDILFSRNIIGEDSPIIEDPFFYEKMDAFLTGYAINNIHIVVSSKCEPLFSDAFYVKYRSKIKIYSLADRSIYNLLSSENKNTRINDIIIVLIVEESSVHFYFRSLLIEKYRKHKIFFLQEFDDRIYKNSYVMTNTKKYIHIEAVNCSEKNLSVDVDLDVRIKYFIKDIPYIFRSKLCEECSPDATDRYGNCKRLYLIPSGFLEKLSFLKKIGDHYFLNFEDRPLMCICFSGENITRKDFFEIRVNGIPIEYPVYSMEDVYRFDRDSMSIQELYQINKFSPTLFNTWKNVEDVLKQIVI